MNCPNCNVLLQMTERQGIEIDYCPQCRGVWLDRGELDKIIERSTLEERPREHKEQEKYYGDKQHHDGEHHDDSRYGKKRKSFLSELFD